MGQKYESQGRARKEPVRFAGHSFRTGAVPGGSGNSTAKWREWMSLRRGSNRLRRNHILERGGIVRWNLLILGIGILAVAGAVAAQDSSTPGSAKKSASHAAAGSAARGKEVFDQKCSMCHFADSDQKKIGPGLKGISKRGTFTVNGNKVTTQSLTTWIENGDSLMPGMKDSLEPAQIKDVVAYVKTL
jgi:cytochrome c